MEKLIEKEKKRRPFIFWWLGGTAFVLALVAILFFQRGVFTEINTETNSKIPKESVERMNGSSEATSDNRDNVKITGISGAKDQIGQTKNKTNTNNRKTAYSATMEAKDPTPIDIADQDISLRKTGEEISQPEHDNFVESIAEEPINLEKYPKQVEDSYYVREVDLLNSKNTAEDINPQEQISTDIEKTKLDNIEMVQSLNTNMEQLNDAVIVSPTPSLRKESNGLHLGVQAGYFFYPATLRSDIHTIQGPMGGLVVAKNISGPWRIGTAVNYATIKTDGSAIGNVSESAFGFGKQEISSTLTSNRLHMMDIPLMVSRKTGPIWLTAGLGAEWLIGMRGSIIKEKRIPEYSLGNVIDQTRTEITAEEVWIKDDFISNFRMYFHAGADLPIAKAFEFGFGLRYFVSPLAEVNDPEGYGNIADDRTMFQIQAAIKYWIK
jgi:hypothetical protein